MHPQATIVTICTILVRSHWFQTITVRILDGALVWMMSASRSSSVERYRLEFTFRCVCLRFADIITLRTTNAGTDSDRVMQIMRQCRLLETISITAIE